MDIVRNIIVAIMILALLLCQTALPTMCAATVVSVALVGAVMAAIVYLGAMPIVSGSVTGADVQAGISQLLSDYAVYRASDLTTLFPPATYALIAGGYRYTTQWWDTVGDMLDWLQTRNAPDTSSGALDVQIYDTVGAATIGGNVVGVYSGGVPSGPLGLYRDGRISPIYICVGRIVGGVFVRDTDNVYYWWLGTGSNTASSPIARGNRLQIMSRVTAGYTDNVWLQAVYADGTPAPIGVVTNDYAVNYRQADIGDYWAAYTYNNANIYGVPMTNNVRQVDGTPMGYYTAREVMLDIQDGSSAIDTSNDTISIVGAISPVPTADTDVIVSGASGAGADTSLDTLGTYVTTQAATGTLDVADVVAPPDYPHTSVGLTQVFPFSLPWDIYDIVSALDAPPEAPVITWRIRSALAGVDETITVDLSAWDTVAGIVRRMELIVLCAGLAMVTRQLIRG